ncbi:phosphate/phosphite/phosphonate ABC transporter substrate-binding protein [Devosia sediminis]|uniref:Phosphate/phosphite/phosphonate ABC transporter substrate-binding protein n=1 Tax=Devosia sediminis TaxID=2798801 RepID=A0A934IUE9_9HYPH|nr:phosphate/phosphite/phosphonate ABC transporter substrate-binding protein [Devosia sediminis]MBJ3784537.1 phosphate/phosphite/phosphonate ABC transporter substrate-binding protein [Devosia sediminis]
MSAIRKLLLASVALSMSTAAFAQDGLVLRIGLDGGENEADQLRRSECVAEPLKAATGATEVQFFPSPDYNGIIQGLLGGTIDIAIMGASSYAAIELQSPDAVDPVLVAQQADGSTGYHTIMVARSDSGITDLASTEGKKLGFADPDSTSGYLIPNVALPADLGKSIEEFYAETGFGGGHENLVLGVLDGTWDVGTTFGSGQGEFSEGYTSGNLRIMVDKGMLDMDDLVEVWQSPIIPNGPLMVSNSLAPEVKQQVTDMFMALPETDFECFDAFTAGGYTKFVEADKALYQTIIDARRSVIGS